MATEVGVGYVTLLPSARGFRRNIERQIGGDVTGAGASAGRVFGQSFTRNATAGITRGTSSIGAAFRSLAASAATAGARITAAAAAAGAAAGLLGLKTAAGLQTAKIGFTTMLDSAKRASKFLTDIRNFAVATPFEVEGLIGNARALLGVGITARNVLPTLRSLGDATAALGLNQDQFNGILRAYTQIASKGKVQAEELLQMAENGIPAVQLFARALGLTVPQLQALTAEGKLTADVALPALLAQLNKDYGGSMGRQFNTLTGLFNNFKETIKLALADGVLPLVPMLQNILPRATAAFGRGIAAASSSLAGFIRGFQGAEFDDGKVSAFEQIGAAAKRAFDSLRSGVVAVLPTIRNLWAFVTGSLFPALRSAFNEVFPQIRAAFASMAETISENQGTFRALGRMLVEVVVPAVAKASGLLADTLGPALIVVVNTIKFVLIPAFAALARGVLTNLDFIISGAAAAFGWMPGIGPKLKKANKDFDRFAAGVNDSLSSILTDLFVTVHVSTVASDIAGGFNGESMTPQQAASQNRRNQLADRASRSAKEAADRAKGDVTSSFGSLGNLASSAMADGLTATAGKVKAAAAETVNKAAEAAKQALQEARQELRDYARSIRDSIRDFGNLTSIGDTGAAATPNSLRNFLRRQLDAIRDFRKNLEALQRRGISDSLLRKIADAGVEAGGPVAAALVAANADQFGDINRLDARINKNARKVGSNVARDLFGGEVAAARQQIINVTINNPRRERASQSAPKAVRRALLAAG